MTRPPSLVAIVARRILVFAALAIVLQVGVVFGEYWFDDDELGRLLVEHETAWIARSFATAEREGAPFPGPDLLERYGLPAAAPARAEPEQAASPGGVVATGYFLRIRQGSGAPVYSNCGADCAEDILPLPRDPPSFWDRKIDGAGRLSAAGGRTYPLQRPGEEPRVIDFASIGDPAGLVYGVLAREMVDHLVVPMGLMLVLVIGGTILSIRQALRPVAAAAAAADAMDPRKQIDALSTSAMPSEIANLTGAINRALGRVAELVRSQKVFAASIAHEIRTPVAVVKLELEQIDHPRARRAERDLAALTHTLEQLTALARIDAAEGQSFRATDLCRLARETAEELAPLVFASGRSIAFWSSGTVEARIVPELVVVLIRNLVENAVKHTKPNTCITVVVQEPGVLSISDNGEGFPAHEQLDTEMGAVKRSGALGLGLKIVDRIAALHGARLAIASSPDGGASVRLEFAS